MIGRALAVRFAAAGHEVMLSKSRRPEALAEVIGSIQGRVSAGTVAEAVRFGQIVVVAIPVHSIRNLPPEAFAGKLVLDTTNYYPEPDGHVPMLDADEITSSQLLAQRLADATIVKAFNTIYFRRLLEDSRPDLPAEQRLAIPVAGDDAAAKCTVIGLIDQIGFTGMDAGTLSETRRQQPGSPLFVAYSDSRSRQETVTASRLQELLSASPPRASADEGRP